MYRYENKQLFKINFAVFSSQALTSFSHDSNHYKLLYRQQKHEEQELVMNIIFDKNIFFHRINRFNLIQFRLIYPNLK